MNDIRSLQNLFCSVKTELLTDYLQEKNHCQMTQISQKILWLRQFEGKSSGESNETEKLEFIWKI